MRRPLVLWTLAFLITAASAVYQRVTGPTYPVSLRQDFNGSPVQARLARAHAGEGNHPVEVDTADPSISGALRFKRFKTADEWTTISMSRSGEILRAELPHQPTAGKLQYQVVLQKNRQEMLLPVVGPVVIRFRGDVPAPVLITHIIAMFGGMLLATYTGLAALAGYTDLNRRILWTLVFLSVGGLLLGPLVQKYAFDAYWTGWPFGTDLTDNKTFVAVAIWVAAWFALARSKNARVWIAVAAVATLIVFMIPHSMFGSEIDYTKIDAK